MEKIIEQDVKPDDLDEDSEGEISGDEIDLEDDVKPKIKREDVELSRFDYEQALQAIKAIQEYAKAESEVKSELFSDDQILDLDVVMKKYPKHLPQFSFIDTLLPHPFREAQTTSTCIFVRDLERRLEQDREKSARIYKEFFEDKHNLSEYSQVLSVNQLLTEYKQYKDLKRLSQSYDIFLADKRLGKRFILRLGSMFIEAKKFPFMIDVSRHVKRNFNRVLKSSRAVLTPSTLKFKVKIGRLNQPAEDLLENLQAVTRMLADHLPGHWACVRSCHIALNKKCELPVYVDWGSMNAIKFPDRKRKELGYIEGELTTLPGKNGNVRVYADGSVGVGKRGEKASKRETVWNPPNSCYSEKARAVKRKAIESEKGQRRFSKSGKKPKQENDSKVSVKRGKAKRQRLDKSLIKVKTDDDIALENIGGDI